MLSKAMILFILYLSVLYAAGFEKDERPGYENFGYEFYPSVNGWVSMKAQEYQATDRNSASIICHLEDAILLSPWNPKFKAVIDELYARSGQYRGIHHGEEVYTTYKNGSLKIIPSEADSYENCTIFSEFFKKDCNQKLLYACFAAKEQVLSTCGNDTEYEYSNITGQCYKFHGYSTYWYLALQTCFKEGAQLAIINSDAEARVLKDIFNRHPEEEILRINRNNNFHTISYNVKNTFIGVYFWKQRNGWYTVDGNRFEDAGYNQWQAHNEEEGIEERVGVDQMRVGVINRDGKIQSVPKYWVYTFICEKDPVI